MTRCKELRRSPPVHSTVVSPTLIIAHPGLGRMYRQLPNTFSLPAGRTCRPPMTLNSSVIVPISVCPPKVIELSCSSGVGWLRKRRTEVSDVSSSVFNELSVPDLIPSCSSRRDCTAATIAWEWRINCSISFRRISIESAFFRGWRLPTMSSWLMVYISIKSNFPSSVLSLPVALYLNISKKG
jgi:hypothetical protein